MATSPSPQRANEVKRSIDAHRDRSVDIDVLLEENAKLRGLVVTLSRLVIRNAADR